MSVVISAAQFSVVRRAHNRSFENGTSFLPPWEGEIVCRIEQFITENLRNSLSSSRLSRFDVTLDLIWLSSHMTNKLGVEFFICFLFKKSRIVINSTKKLRLLEFLFNGLYLLDFLVCNLFANWLFSLFRQLSQIFFIRVLLFLGDSKLIAVKSRVGVAMFNKQTFWVLGDCLIISLFQAFLIEWIDNALDSFSG